MAADIIARGLGAAALSGLKGKADLVGGKIPQDQLPSYVDDVIEVETYEDLPQPGETGKIYVVLTGQYANYSFRWSGSEYIPIGSMEIPACPADEDGQYVLVCKVVNGVKTYSWSGGSNNSVFMTTEDEEE